MMIRSRFGTFRGLVRLALSYPQLALGRSASVPPDPAHIRRLVFLCQGNICRSAFADMVAQRARVRTASKLQAHTAGMTHIATLLIAARRRAATVSSMNSCASRWQWESIQGVMGKIVAS